MFSKLPLLSKTRPATISPPRYLSMMSSQGVWHGSTDSLEPIAGDAAALCPGDIISGQSHSVNPFASLMNTPLNEAFDAQAVLQELFADDYVSESKVVSDWIKGMFSGLSVN